jgi:hypothetical protein
MNSSYDMFSFAFVAIMIVGGIMMLSSVVDIGGLTNTTAPLHSTFSTMASLLNSGFGLAAIGIIVLGAGIVLRVFDYI